MFEVVIFSLIGGVFSLIGGLTLIRSKKSAGSLAKYATPFAAGVLLATAFSDLLPEALHEHGDNEFILKMALLGVLIFFMLERFLRWFHHHHEHGKEKAKNSLVITGDTLHNALDGVAIGASFLINVPTGIVTTLAVAAHEIPQEIGDFGLLLRNGMEKSRVILVNVLSALSTTVVAVAVYAFGDSDGLPVSALLAITAGFFIYVASSDIIPEIHERTDEKYKDIRPWLLLLGAVIVIFLSPALHSYIDSDSHNESTTEHHHESADHN